MTISRAQIATCNTTAMVKTNWIACITTAGGFDAARRGQISHAETQALARDLGITADDLLARRSGQAFNAEEAYAARAILDKSGKELVAMARRIQRSGDARAEEHTSELQALMRNSYAVFCLKKTKKQ